MSKKYWNEREENLIVKYKESEDERIRNRILNKLYPKLWMMAEAILFRYYDRYLPDGDNGLMEITEALNRAILAIDKFDPSKGSKAYSYLQTVIKKRYYTIFIRSTKNNEFFNNAMSNNQLIEGEDRDINDYVIQNDSQIEKFELYSDKELVLGRLYSILKEYDGQIRMKRYCDVINVMIDYIENTDEFTYEGMIIKIIDELDMLPESIANRFRKLGFNSTGIFGIYKGYNDIYGDTSRNTEPLEHEDWKYYDQTPNDYVSNSVIQKRRNKE